VAAAGVGDRGQQREGGPVQAGGDVAEVDRLPVGQRRGCTQRRSCPLLPVIRPVSTVTSNSGQATCAQGPAGSSTSTQAIRSAACNCGGQCPTPANSSTAASAA
jgi:hypothetical protein